MNFQLESWNAIAPGLDNPQAWAQWLQDPTPIEAPLGKLDLSAIPAMLRRRFNTLGKCAMAAALPLVKGVESIPSIFASRHGDTELSFSMLNDMGQEEPLSPTQFSLAVHNAISGLFTIARKDTSETTAIASMEGLVLQTLFEALGQLQQRERVLCVIYDMPLPDFYSRHSVGPGDPFPFAVAMKLARSKGEGNSLQLTPAENETSIDSEFVNLMGLLCGLNDQALLGRAGAAWQVTRIRD